MAVRGGGRRLEALNDEALRHELARIGPQWAADIRAGSQRVKALYEPWLAAAPRGDIAVHRDLPYGPHPRMVLDVFQPRAAARAPVIVFVHGGAFVRGDKRTTPELYDNVLTWFARQGCLGVNVEYRLAPEARYPAGAQDVGGAVAWLRLNAGRFGGDPACIHLVGHSAGGTHAAGHVYDPTAGGPSPAVCGLVLISARLRADVLPANPNREGVLAYYGPDPAVHERASPMGHASPSRVPTLVVTAEYENPLLDAYGAEFAARLRASGHPRVEHRVVPGHNHMSIVAHFNTAEETLGRQILAFLGIA